MSDTATDEAPVTVTTPPPASAEIISLGYACEAKYQISRHLYFRQHPDGAEEDFRRMLMGRDHGQRAFERHVFDWQITPFEAVIRYLESDFKGVFERADFAVNGSGEVEHWRLKTRHPHDFLPMDGVLDARAIDLQYEAARSKFEHLAAKFRTLLQSEAPQLFVFKQIRIYDDAVRLLELLGGDRPGRDVKLLFVDYDGQDQMLDALEGRVFRGWVPAQADKPADRQWEGDDARWDGILRPFDLRLPGGRLPKTFEASLAAKTPSAPPPRRGLFATLFGR